tara:strand:+ start:98 stop:454 length:357 start_codon:yes stop_codon:yes gene_type:complete
MPDIINTIIALFLTALFFVVLALAISQPIISIWAAVTGRGRFLAYFVGVFLAGVVLLPVLHTVVVDSPNLRGILGSEFREGLEIMIYLFLMTIAPISLALSGLFYWLGEPIGKKRRKL